MKEELNNQFLSTQDFIGLSYKCVKLLRDIKLLEVHKINLVLIILEAPKS